ncbi:hypothetical protein HPP92_028801, partial [Vanilla planifolia]
MHDEVYTIDQKHLAIDRQIKTPFGDSEKCNQEGNAYISFGQWHTPFAFTFESDLRLVGLRSSLSFISQGLRW